MHEHQLSQFRPGESQRSRNVPDVLFVDEDGNPIEAGEENLIFVDEKGLEMTEEKAIQLIESGKYIDSRVLYDDDLGPLNRSNSMSFHGSTNSYSYSSNILNMAKSNSMIQPQKSNSLTHAQIQAVQAAQIAQTQAMLNAAPTPSYTADTSTAKLSDLMDQQAKIFAEAHVKAREQEDELAHIEADAYSSYSESLHRTKSDRRLPNRPDKKAESFTEETYELDKIIKEQERKMQNSTSYQNSVESQQAQNKSNSFHLKQKRQEEQIMRQQQEQQTKRANQKEEQEREYLKEQLIKKQQELMEQHLLEKRQQELIVQQQAKEKEAKEEKRRLKRERKERKEAEKAEKRQREQERQIREQQRMQEEQERLEREHEAMQREQQRLYREQQGLEREQREQERRRKEEKKQRELERQQKRELERQKEEQEERRHREIIAQRKEEEYGRYAAHQKKSYSSVPSVSGISKTSSITKISQKSSTSSFLQQQNHTKIYKPVSTTSSNNYFNYNNNNSNIYTSNYSQPSTGRRSPRMTNQTRRSIEAYSKDYDVCNVRQVGQLSGYRLIRDYNNVNLDQFEKYYDQDKLEFEPHHLDQQSTQFIDPFSADLFKDEMVDIDFGAIDAFTEALNAQIVAEKNGSEPPKNLQFPSHVIASNHGSFLDTQMLMSDTTGGLDECSGVNVQFITPNLRNKTGSTTPGTGFGESNLEKKACDEYARNQSFDSMIDLQRMHSAKSGSQKSNYNGSNSFVQSQLNKHNMTHQSLVR